ncbi:UNVERIFIED_CONTAM: hypothetical protein PYX00_004040 [Menopon gallinae]|uniref:prostaglandin-endoperoxide synthase n=1 Tax=Menopon gallinae TaxID=328185 RepID=A0AAW2I4S4_9NEOP
MTGRLIFYLLCFSSMSFVEANTDEKIPAQREYNPCCSMPCQHRGVCIPVSNVLYECDCAKGYFGKSCEKATFLRWVSDQFQISHVAKQKIALSGKLLWAIINNIPLLHDTALRYVFLSGSRSGGMDHHILSFVSDFTSIDAFYNQSYTPRGLPPVPTECPTPLGIKGPKHLPDVEEVFELLFKRRQFKPCPQGSNIMLATFAEQLSHQFFSADAPARGYNGIIEDSVSHIYGSDEKTRKALRSMENGKLKTRIIKGEEFPPYLEDAPGVNMVYPEGKHGGRSIYPKWALGHKMSSSSPFTFVLGTIWLREHNRLCDIILKEHPDWSDERIYQTARWIVSGELLTITAGEYFQHLAQYRLKFSYKPQLFHDNPVQTSTQLQNEFSLMFQWHQTTPDDFSVNGQNYNMSDLRFSNNRIVFEHGLDAVVDAMCRSPAGEITYRNCGDSMKVGMKDLIKMGRNLRLHSLNDYRRFYDLKPYDSFKELVGDAEMATVLKEIYGDIDAVEFVVGVFLEKHPRSVLPPTMVYLAGPVVLKGVMESPLGSTALWRPSTFGGKTGFDIVQKATLRKLFCLNLKGNCKNNVWVSFRTPANTSKKKF